MSLRRPQDVQAALDELGVSATICYHDLTTATAQQAADAIGTPLGSIVKSLCFLLDQEPVVVLVAGDRSVDDRKLARHFGVSRKKVRIADAQTTQDVTGYAPGGVPPVGHAQAVSVLIDQSLARFETIHAAAGSPHAVFATTFDGLVQITSGRVMDLARDKRSEPEP